MHKQRAPRSTLRSRLMITRLTLRGRLRLTLAQMSAWTSWRGTIAVAEAEGTIMLRKGRAKVERNLKASMSNDRSGLGEMSVGRRRNGGKKMMGEWWQVQFVQFYTAPHVEFSVHFLRPQHNWRVFDFCPQQRPTLRRLE